MVRPVVVVLALVGCWACGDNVTRAPIDNGGGGDSPLCRTNGLCVEAPAPLEVPLIAVTPGPAGDIWAASAGDVLHWDDTGIHYERARSHANRQLRIESLVVGGTGVYALAAEPGGRNALVRRTHAGRWDLVEEVGAAIALSGQGGDAWVVTAAERVMHLEDEQWIDRGPLPGVKSLVANTPSDVWATMHDGRLAHYDGFVWKNRGKSPVTFSIRSVVGSADECWIVTMRDDVVHMKVDDMDPDHKPRIEPAIEVIAELRASAIVARSLGDVLVLGYDRFSQLPRAARFDGTMWTETTLPIAGRVFAATLAGDTLVTAGANGEITRDADHAATSTRAADAPSGLFAVAVAPGSDDVWGLDTTGALAHRSSDATWHVVSEAAQGRDLFVRVPGEPWLHDFQGRLQRFDGTSFVDTGLPYVYFACAQPGGGVVATTSLGAYASSDGRSFTPLATYLPYAPLSCPSDDAVWGTYFVSDARGVSRLDPSGGARGVAAGTEEAWMLAPLSTTVSNLDGGMWRTYDTVLDADGVLGDVAATAADNVWIVGAHGRVVTFDGGAFVRHDTGVDEMLVSVTTASATDVTAVGEDGSVAHWDGTSWAIVHAVSPSAIRDAHVFSPTNAIAVGVGGAVLAFDGTQWTAGPDVFGRGMSELHVVTPTNLWAVDATRTELWHFDGTGWTELGAEVAPFSAVSVEGTQVHVLDVSGQIWHLGAAGWERTTTIPWGYGGSLIPRGNGTRFAVGGSVGYLDDGMTTRPLDVAHSIVGARAGTDGMIRFADAEGRVWRVSDRVLSIGMPALPAEVFQLESALVLDDTHAWAVGATRAGQRRLMRRDGDAWVSVLEAAELPDRTLQPVGMDAAGLTTWFATSDGRLLRSP